MARHTSAQQNAPKKSRLTGSSSKAAFQKGITLYKAGKLRDAIACFETALSAATAPSDQANALQRLADSSRMLGDQAIAIEFYNRALMAAPDREEAIVPLASIYAEQGRHQDAQNLLTEKLKLYAKSAPLWLCLGNVTREAGDLENAEIFVREAIAQKPGYALAYGALGDLLSDKGETEAAFDAYDTALKKNPKLDRVRYHRGLLHLACGNLQTGWREFEKRFSAMGDGVSYTHGLRLWDGTSLKNRSLLVTAEQGIGDQIVFASTCPDLIDTFASDTTEIFIECEERLVSLFARSFPAAKVVPLHVVQDQGRRIAEYQWLANAPHIKHCIPMGTLNRHFRADMPAMPQRTTYLQPDASQAEVWRSWLSNISDKPKVGICWRSSNVAGARGLQFANSEDWQAFIHSLPFDLVTLQYDAPDSEITELARRTNKAIHIPPGLDQKNDLDQTAALIAQLDAVVSAPTAVASMAAALDIDTFKIIRDRTWTAFGCDYEPLTPACKLMRGEKAGDWSTAFEKTRLALLSTLKA